MTSGVATQEFSKEQRVDQLVKQCAHPSTFTASAYAELNALTSKGPSMFAVEARASVQPLTTEVFKSDRTG